MTETPEDRESSDEGAETIYGDDPGSESAPAGGIAGNEQAPDPEQGDTIYGADDAGN